MDSMTIEQELPEVEVTGKAERRRFSAEYKRKILKAADACSRPGELGALLRKEGLYSSNLTAWRAARDRGEIAGLTPKKRGPKAEVKDGRDRRIAELEREAKRWKARAERAEALVDLQKKVSEILGITLPESEGQK
jgi:transposase-like protein